MLSIRVNGTEFTNVLSITFRSNILDFNNEASFSIAFKHGDQVPFTTNDEVEVLMDRVLVLTGYIYRADIIYDDQSHSINYLVTDRTRDFSDSQIDVINGLSASLSLIDIIKKVLAHLGLTKISVDTNIKDLANFSQAIDGVSPEIGDNAFDYCSALCFKKQAILRTNGKGNIELVRNSGDKYSEGFVNKIKGDNINNFTRASYSFDISKSFRKYVVKSNANTSSNQQMSLNDAGASNASYSNQVGRYEDSSSRKGRQRVLISQESSSNVDNEMQAKWLADYGRSTRLQFSIDYPSHSLGGEILKVNKLVNVVDDFTGISGFMLIQEINCTTDINGGDGSSITLVDKDSFTLTLNDVTRDNSLEKAGKETGFKLSTGDE